MTQLLAFKIVLVPAFVSMVAWIVVYWRLAPWWRNELGRTFVFKAALIAALFLLTMLSVFFNLNRQTSQLIGWIDIVLIGLVTPVMVNRIFVFVRDPKKGGQV